MTLCLPMFTFASSNKDDGEKEENEDVINPDNLSGEWWLVKLRVQEKKNGKIVNDGIGRFAYKKELDSSEKHKITLNRNMVFTDEYLTYDSMSKSWLTISSNQIFLKNNDNNIYLSDYDDFREKIICLDEEKLVIEGSGLGGNYSYVKTYKRV